MVASTLLGGDGPCTFEVRDLHLDPSGVGILMGSTRPGFIDGFVETPGAWDDFAESDELFVTVVRPDASGLLYSSLLGGPAADIGFGGALASGGDVYLFGSAAGLPTFDMTPGAFDTTWGGAGLGGGFGDGVIARLEPQPTGATSFGEPTSACHGSLRLWALEPPIADDSDFSVACTGAPPLGLGAWAVGAAVEPAWPLLGARLYLDPVTALVLIPATADGWGQADLSIAVPSGAAGFKVGVQAVWVLPPTCSAQLGLGASDALRLTLL